MALKFWGVILDQNEVLERYSQNPFKSGFYGTSPSTATIRLSVLGGAKSGGSTYNLNSSIFAFQWLMTRLGYFGPIWSIDDRLCKSPEANILFVLFYTFFPTMSVNPSLHYHINEVLV